MLSLLVLKAFFFLCFVLLLFSSCATFMEILTNILKCSVYTTDGIFFNLYLYFYLPFSLFWLRNVMSFLSPHTQGKQNWVRHIRNTSWFYSYKMRNMLFIAEELEPVAHIKMLQVWLDNVFPLVGRKSNLFKNHPTKLNRSACGATECKGTTVCQSIAAKRTH